MKTRLSRTLAFFLILSLLFLIGCSTNSGGSESVGSTDNSKPKVGLGIGNQAPDFTITMDDGKTIKLSELKGQPVFLNFWATWCPPCKKEMPDIQKISKESRSVRIIGVNVKENPMQVRSFLNSNGYTFPVGYDTKGDIAALYMATGIPTSYAIDTNGIIRHQIQGPLTYAQLNQWFTSLETTK